MTDRTSTTKQDAAYILDAHKHLLMRVRDELTCQIDKLTSLQVALMREDDDE